MKKAYNAIKHLGRLMSQKVHFLNSHQDYLSLDLRYVWRARERFHQDSNAEEKLRPGDGIRRMEFYH